MRRPSDLPEPAWACSWASALAHEQVSCFTLIPSNEMNQVLRLTLDDGALFLKIGPNLGREYDRLQWLQGRLACPRPVGFTTHDGVDAILMSAIDGDDLASLSASLPPPVIVARLVTGLQAIHRTDIADWPFGGSDGVLVHGDACLPNFLCRGDDLTGYIDVGDMAIGDPEVDLAAAVWSLQYNMGPGHGLALLRAYGAVEATEEDVERLRLRYEQG